MGEGREEGKGAVKVKGSCGRCKEQHQKVEDKMDNKMHTIRTKEKSRTEPARLGSRRTKL